MATWRCRQVSPGRYDAGNPTTWRARDCSFRDASKRFMIQSRRRGMAPPVTLLRFSGRFFECRHSSTSNKFEFRVSDSLAVNGRTRKVKDGFCGAWTGPQLQCTRIWSYENISEFLCRSSWGDIVATVATFVATNHQNIDKLCFRSTWSHGIDRTLSQLRSHSVSWA